MTMTPNSTSVSKLEDPDDLLLSYLNADCLDTTNATGPALEMINTKPPLSPSSISLDDPFSPHSSYSSPWPSMPFIFNVNALASACMGSPDLTAGISPCSISRFGSPSSPNVPTCFVPVPDAKDNQSPNSTPLPSSSSSSPTISTASSVSSSDADEPKRKRERRKQPSNGLVRNSLQSSATMHNCKPILPAANNHQLHHLMASSLVNVKPEPVDLDTAIVLSDSNPDSKCHATTTKLGANRHALSNKKQPQQHNANETHPSRQQQQQKTTAVDTHSKRQERLIKNRAAALLSRKRKREHLQALEHERQWLTKDNELLKSKMATLEAKILALENENQHQKHRYSLLEQQQQRRVFHKDDLSSTYNNKKWNNDMNGTSIVSSHSLDPIVKVTNVLMILLLSFALLAYPMTSDAKITISEDKDTSSSSFIRNNDNEKNLSTLCLPLVLHRQQQQQQQHLRQHISDHTTDKSIDVDMDLERQHPMSPPPLHHLKLDQKNTAASIDHIRLQSTPTLIRKRKCDTA